MPSIERPFKYNNKFPLLKQEIINDAYNYYVKCWRSVPMGFVKHVEEMVHIDEGDIDHETLFDNEADKKDAAERDLNKIYRIPEYDVLRGSPVQHEHIYRHH